MISLLLKVGKMVTDVDDKQLSNNKPTMNMLFQFQTALWEGPQPWAAQLGGVGTVSPHFWDQQCTGGGSNETDLCFYGRQSLFSTVQVTEFQLP